MEFREYYRLHEDQTYILMKNRRGQYQVIIAPPDQKQLPQAIQAAKDANNPQGIWTYSISGGKLNLPPELAADKEPILMAHYTRMGFNKMGTPEPQVDDESEYIDPSVFNPEYGWKKHNQPGTIDYTGNPLSGTAPTPPPRRI